MNQNDDDKPENIHEFGYSNYKGKKILIAVMYFKEVAPALNAINEFAAMLEKEPEQSVRVLLDVTEGKIFEETTALWKQKLPLFDKHVLRGAVVGPAWMRSITSAVLLVARLGKLGVASRVKAFATIAEAREYLVQD